MDAGHKLNKGFIKISKIKKVSYVFDALMLQKEVQLNSY